MAKKNKKIPKNEFRYNKKAKHMNYIFEEDDKNYHSLGLTTDKYTFNKLNMRFNVNPQKNRNYDSYIRNGIISQRKNTYARNTDKRFIFDISDFPNVKSKIRKYKSNRKHKKR